MSLSSKIKKYIDIYIVIKLKTKLRPICSKELYVRESKVQTKYSNLFHYKER